VLEHADGGCLDARFDGDAAAHLSSRACTGNSEQRFTMAVVELLIAGERCLGQWASDTRLSARECDETDRQVFRFDADQTLRRLADDQCMTVRSDNTIALEPCRDGDGAQHWRLGKRGQLLDAKTGRCIAATTREDGAAVALRTCDSSFDQRLRLRGEVRSAGNQCLDQWGHDTADFTPATFGQCHGGPNQRWMYFP
jgi:hypothetical protein